MLTKQEIVKRMLDGWTQDGFCQNEYALDADSHPVAVLDITAIRWCAIGRMWKVSTEGAEADIRLQVIQDFQIKYGESISGFNDRRSFAEMKRALENLYGND